MIFLFDLKKKQYRFPAILFLKKKELKKHDELKLFGTKRKAINNYFPLEMFDEQSSNCLINLIVNFFWTNL
jgi:hypothetical protein